MGKIVDGFDTLDKMEKSQNCPIETIRIENVHILSNPFKGATRMPEIIQFRKLKQQTMAGTDPCKRKQSNNSLGLYDEVFILLSEE